MALMGYGTYCLFWPEAARHQYLKQFTLGVPVKWSDPTTWMPHPPNNLVFQLFGLMCIGFSILLLFILFELAVPAWLVL
jgi:hypothetical protein